MKNSRLIYAMLLALVISGGCTLVLGRKLAPRTAPTAPQQHYIAAARAIEAGEVVKADALKEIDWPANETLQGGFSKMSDVVGRASIYPIAAGQPVIDKDLAVAGSGLGLTTRIPDGMRALALRSDDVVGVGGFLYPGSHVDTLVTYHAPGNPDPVTATVLQDTEVLAIDHQAQPDPNGKPTTVGVVTLLLTPENAERVVLASTQGTIHFVLRNGADQKQVNDGPALMSQFAGAAVRAAAPRPVTRASVERPKGYIVETIRGDKAEQSTF